MRRRPRPDPHGRPAASWLRIQPNHWHTQIADAGNGLLIDCPTHHCDGQIFTLARPGHDGAMIVSCSTCCRKMAVILVGWESPAPASRGVKPPTEDETLGT